MNPDDTAERYPLILMDVTGPDVMCQQCCKMVPVGERVLVFSAPPTVVHEGPCPRTWTPTVVHGEGRDPQRRLPFLTVVEGGAE